MLRTLLREQAAFARARYSLRRSRPFGRHLASNRQQLNSKNVAFYARNLSSATEQRPDEHELDKFTNRILHGRANRLGAMTVEQWDDTLMVMVYWLRMDENENDKAAAMGPNVSGFAVDAVDHLLQRLIYEHATRSVASRHRTEDLANWLLAVLQAWLHLSERHPASNLAVERAEKAWKKVVEWKDHGWWKESLPLNEFAGLIRAWLRVESSHGVEQAAALLMSEEMNVFHSNGADVLISCYHEALKQAIIYGEADGSTPSLLIERMEWLSKEPGWETVKPDEETIMGILDGMFESGNYENEKVLSAFEAKTLHQRMVERIQKAGSDDANIVENIIEHWSKAMATSESTSEVAEALVGYYTRIGDPAKATFWLKKLDPIPVEIHDRIVDQVMHIITLWEEKAGSEAPWRVDELVSILEKDASGRDRHVDPALYAAVADLWLRSDNPRAGKKAQESLVRTSEFSANLLRMMTQAIIQDPGGSEGAVTWLIKHLNSDWSHLNSSEQSEFADKVAQAISASKLSQKALEFTRFLLNQGFTPSAVVCESLANSFSSVSEPGDVVDFADLLEESGAPLSFNCYCSMVTSLFWMEKKLRRKQLTDLTIRTIDRIAEGKIQADSTEIGSLIARVLKTMAMLKGDKELLFILDSAESKLLTWQSNDQYVVPLSCLQSVIEILGKNKKFDSVEEVFNRVSTLSRDGFSDVFPNSSFFTTYMLALARDQVGGEKTVRRLEKVLEDAIKFHETEGKAECKPVDKMFSVILLEYREEPTVENAHRSVAMLDRMISLDVEFRDAFIFNTTMDIVLRSSQKFGFEKAMAIVEKMKTKKVNPDHFTFHNILRACARAEPQSSRALETALETLSEVRECGKTTVDTYKMMLVVFRKLLPPKDQRLETLVARVFQLCCADGYLNEDVRKRMEDLIYPATWNQMYKQQLLDGVKEPREWSRNVNASE